MKRELTIGTVSWINRTPNPITSTVETQLLTPEWIPKTFLGLAATANPDPGETIGDFGKFRSGKHFRAMNYAKLSFEADDTTGAITKFTGIEAWQDPGYTPPFSQSSFPLTFLAPDMSIWSNTWYAGEMSPFSKVCHQARHPNSAITGVGAGETVLVNAMIKFRAGTHTDNIGIKNAGCPFHVPWVWNEVLVTLAGGKVKLYGRASVFPSHAWYIDGKRVAAKGQVGDSSFPKKSLLPSFVPRFPGFGGLGMAPNPLVINETALLTYPVLAAGAPASGSQTTLGADKGLTTSVETHANAVKGNPIVMV